jgi:hypothetical protein
MTRRKQPDTYTMPAQIVMTEDQHSTHFYGAAKVLRAARRRVGCPFQMDPRSGRLSVPRRFGERVADAIETRAPRGVIADRGLWSWD